MDFIVERNQCSSSDSNGIATRGNAGIAEEDKIVSNNDHIELLTDEVLEEIWEAATGMINSQGDNRNQLDSVRDTSDK